MRVCASWAASTAGNGTQAIAKLRQQHYDLIVMDLNMPPLDGYAAAEKIRHGAAPGQQDIPIVAYTSESAYMAHVKTQKVGMNGFVSKPCTQVELALALQLALESASRQAQTQDRAARALAGKTVLVVDDDGQNRKIASIYLHRLDVNTLHAEHGLAAIAILEAGAKVDAVLMDMQMPGMSGVEAARIIRQNAACAHIPIIALTANFSDQHIEQALAAGMNDFISKPMEPDQLRDKLTALLGGGGARPIAAGAVQPVPIRDKAEHDGVPLINVHHLEQLRRTDPQIMQECLDIFIPQMQEMLLRIETHIADRDFEAFYSALHTLLGNAGDAGFHALHQYLKAKVYPQAAQAHEWPSEINWLETARDLYGRTVRAMQGSYIAAG